MRLSGHGVAMSRPTTSGWLGHALSAALCVLPLASANAQPSLRVQADQWCPFNCDPRSDHPGYVVEILHQVFDAPPRRVDYQVVPWRRALSNTREGRADAVIGMTAPNAVKQGFVVGAEAVGASSDCVLVRNEHPLQVSTPTDLTKLQRIGVAADYDYTGALGAWIADPQNAKRLRVTRDELPAETNLKNLDRGLLDAVIDDYAVTSWLLKTNHRDERIRYAWCDAADPVFVAFSAKAAEAKERAQRLDAGIAELRRSGALAKLLARYGLRDWAAR